MLAEIPTSAPRACGSRCGVRSPIRYGAQSKPSAPAGVLAASSGQPLVRVARRVACHAKLVPKPSQRKPRRLCDAHHVPALRNRVAESMNASLRIELRASLSPRTRRPKFQSSRSPRRAARFPFPPRPLPGPLRRQPPVYRLAGPTPSRPLPKYFRRFPAIPAPSAASLGSDLTPPSFPSTTAGSPRQESECPTRPLRRSHARLSAGSAHNPSAA